MVTFEFNPSKRPSIVTHDVFGSGQSDHSKRFLCINPLELSLYFSGLANSQQTPTVSSNTQSNPDQLAFRSTSPPDENSVTQNTTLSTMLSAVPPVEANPPYESNQMNLSKTDSMMYLLPILRSHRKKTSSGQDGQGEEGGQGGDRGTGWEGGRHTKQAGARNEASQEQQKESATGKNNFLKTLINLMLMRNMRNQGINFGQIFGDMLQQRKSLGDRQDKGGAHGAERMISLQDLLNHMKMNRDGITGNANIMYDQPRSETAIQGGFDGQYDQMKSSQDMLMPDGAQGLAGIDMNTLLDMQMQMPQVGETGNMMLAPSIGDGSQEVTGGMGIGGGMASMDHFLGGMGISGQPHDIYAQLLMSQAGVGQTPMNLQQTQVLQLLTALSMQPGMGGKTQEGVQEGGNLQNQMVNEGTGVTNMPIDQSVQGQGQMGDGSMLDMASMGGLSNVLGTVGTLRALGFGGLKSQMANQESMEQPAHVAGIWGEGPSLGTVSGGEAGGEGQSGGGEGGNEGSPKRDRKSKMRRLLMLLALQKQFETNNQQQNNSITNGDKDFLKFGMMGNNSIGSSNIRLMGASRQPAIPSSNTQGVAESYQLLPQQNDRLIRRNFRSQWFSKLTKYFNNKKTQGQEEEAGAGEGMKSGTMTMFGGQKGAGEEGDMTSARGMQNGRLTQSNLRNQWFSKLTRYFNIKQKQGQEEEAWTGEGIKSGIMNMLGRQKGAGEEGDMTGAQDMQNGRLTQSNLKSQLFSKLIRYFNNKKMQGQEEEAGAGEGMKSGTMTMFGRQKGAGVEGAMTGEQGMRTDVLRLIASQGAMSRQFGMSAFGKQFMKSGDGEGGQGSEGNTADGSCRRYPYTLMGNTLIFPSIDGNCKL